MPIALVLVWRWIRLVRKRIDPRLKLAQVGGTMVVVGALLVVELWLHFKPPGIRGAYKWGELAGVMAVYLMSVSLLLATRARWLEPGFGGLDRMYLWHRRLSILAMLLLLPHVLVTGRGRAVGAASHGSVGRALGVLSALGLVLLVAVSARRIGDLLRIPYQRWLLLHRLTGLFFLSGAVHGILLDDVIGSSSTLMVAFVAISAVGTGAYGYSELLRRRVEPQADYEVSEIRRLPGDVVELHLAPRGEAVSPRPGQFVFLRIAGRDRWGAHPFSVSGHEPDGGIRLSIRALGRDTRAMHETLISGDRGAVSGPHGMFDYTLGGQRQVWIAGGIGIAPFLSWLQALSDEDDHSIDLFYSVRTEADAAYLAEAIGQAERLRSVRIHPVLTAREGRLTIGRVLDVIDPPLSDVHAFLCGPERMVDGLTRALRRHGLPREHLHAEEFAFR